ncbi:MAG TPA: MFS transporter [Rugosibacter sp.]
MIPPATTEIDLNRAVLILAGAAFASAASFRVCDPFLPTLASSFNVSISSAAHVITAFVIAYSVFQLVFGPLGDRIDRYHLVAYSTLACTLGSIACGLSPSYGWLVASRALTGAFSAGIIAVGVAWISDQVPLSQRQPMLARFISGQILGMVSGQVIGGLFVDTLGWRLAFAALALIYLYFGWLLLRQAKIISAILPPRPPALSGNPFLSVGHDLFAVVQSPNAWPVFAAICFEGMAVFSVLAFLPLYLHTHFGISMTKASLALMAYGAGGLVYSYNARRLTGHFSVGNLALLGSASVAMSLLLLYFVPIWYLTIPVMSGAGFGMYLLHSTILTRATAITETARGLAISLTVSIFFVGQSVGIYVASRVVEIIGIPPVILAASLLIMLVGIGFSTVSKKRQELAS